VKIPRHAKKEPVAVPMTTFTDLIFTLIIFFMATTTFREQERDIQVNLPDDSKNESLSSVEKVIVINVRKSGAYVLKGEQVTLDELARLVAAAVKADPTQKVLVRADQEALHGYVAQAVAICKQVGVSEANIGYEVPR
jgi:biopolymer transport protein ExbD